MPIKNSIKAYDIPAYYHVYNRGAGQAEIFHEDKDRYKFLSILQRHLDPDDTTCDANGRAYDKYPVKLVAYCLMSNHFHLLLYQDEDVEAITQLMRSVATAYTMYFNKKYKQSGHLFQGVFKASHINNESYLSHISRYIHMNPRRYLRYQWSSIGCYLGWETSNWVYPELASDMNPVQYRQFLEEYEGRKTELELLKSQLAT